MDSLGELVDVLAAQPSTAAPRLRGILSLCSPAPSAKQLSATKNVPPADSQPQMTPRQLDSVLALARFLAASQGHFRQQLLPYILGFLKALLVSPAAAAGLSARSPFFPQILKPLFTLARVDAESQKSISGAVAEILQEITGTTQLSQGEEPLLPVVQDFLAALGEGPVPLLGGDAENVAKWLHERWIGGPQGASSSGLHLRANSQPSNGEQGKQANGKGDTDGPLPGSRSPSVASLSESSDDISEFLLRGSRSSDSLRAAVDEEPSVIKRREWAFRIFAQLLPQARVDGGPTDKHLLGAFRDLASKQLKTMVHTLQPHSPELPHRRDAEARFLASSAAGQVLTGLAVLEPQGAGSVRMTSVRHAANLLLDVVDAAVLSKWRHFPPCHRLVEDLLTCLVHITNAHPGTLTRDVFVRLRSVVLNTAVTQSRSAGTAEWAGELPQEADQISPLARCALRAAAALLHETWPQDEAVCLTFMLALGSNARPQEGDSGTTIVWRRNLITLVAELALEAGLPKVAEAVASGLLETLQEPTGAVTGPTRLRLLDALAKVAELGVGTAYREVVVLLVRLYFTHVQASMDSPSTADSSHRLEGDEALPAAFLHIAQSLPEGEQRADCRVRLLALASDVGLIVESRDTSAGGAKCLGRLLPALAELCKGWAPETAVPTQELKLFRNLWFYIALLGLGPPLPNAAPSVPRPLTKGTAKLVNTSMRAVTGPYAYPAVWIDAVETIAEGTPPLVVSSTQWVEDEEELTALHQPGSRSGSGSEKAATLQRAALASALANKVDANALLTISGVKATYLLAVAYLEMLRLSRFGGVLPPGLQRQGSAAGDPPGTSWLACTFKYLEAPNLTDQVRACLEAITSRAFASALSTLRRAAASAGEESVVHDAIAGHACFLLGATTHFISTVADVADRLLTHLRSSFPEILWHPRCMTYILELLGRPPSENLNADVQAMLQSQGALQERVREWLSLAITLAPVTMQGLLQEHLQRLQQWPGPLQSGDLLTVLAGVQGGPPPGGMLAAATSAAAAGGGGAAKGTRDGVSAGILAATIKSKYAGEVAGMRRLYHTLTGASATSPPGQALSQLLSLGSAKYVPAEGATAGPSADEFDELLVLRFVSNLEHCRDQAQKGAQPEQAALRETCLRGAALLLASNPGHSQLRPPYQRLLRLLAWCPVLVFTPASLELGVFVWTWLLSAAPPLTLRLLAELTGAWLHCAATRLGLFSTVPAEQGERALLRPQVTPGEPEGPPARQPVEAIHAHRLWLGFFQDRLQVARHGRREQLALLGRLFSPLARPPALTRHPAAAGTVFSYLLLGLEYCAVRSQSPAVDLLHDQILRAALAWFETPPAWYDHRDGVLERAEAGALVEFARALEKGPGQKSGAEVKGKHPVWGSEAPRGAARRGLLLASLVRHEADRLLTWANPLKQDAVQNFRSPPFSWGEAVSTAWAVSPRLAIALVSRFPSIAPIHTAVTSLVGSHIPSLIGVAEALPFFVTPAAVAADSPVLNQLVYWAPCSIAQALDLLTPAFAGHPRVMAYVLRVLQGYPPQAVMFFMPQLVQALRYDHGGLIEGYLMAAAQDSNLFAHRLIWQLQGEEAPPPGEADPKHPIAPNALWDIVGRVKQRIVDGFSPEARSVYEREFRLFDGITAISGKIKPLPKEQRRAAIKPALEGIEVEGEDCYLPTAPDKLVVGIQRDSGVALQSAAKAPFLLAFDVRDRGGDPSAVHTQGCIFKEGDDCRQDVLALQVISLLRDMFAAVHLDLYLCPYGVLPTGFERGIIEMVPNTRSRTQMGEVTDHGLFQMYQHDYGPVGSAAFEAARNNFIVSSAGYAVASLLLQPKDRHNGNLLYDNKGRLIHIDFGFILEISPGGNMRFESADFKLSHEMTQLLDPSGAMKSDSWARFVSLCVKGYLAARVHAEAIISTVDLMVDSGLPCFSRGDPMGNLRKRMHLEMTEREAANFMIATCEDAYNKWTTSGYDVFQYLQQDIQH